MIFPSNFELTMVGDDLDQLKQVLRILDSGSHLHTNGHVIFVPPELAEDADPADTDEGDPRYQRVPALIFYAHGKPDGAYQAKKMSKPDSIAFFIYSWLESLEESDYGQRFYEEGGRRGWRLNAGYSAGGIGEYNPKMELAPISDIYPEIDFRYFQYLIRPEWTFYAK